MTGDPVEVEQLLSEYESGGLSRRDFFIRAGALGISLSVAGRLLSAASARAATDAALFAGIKRGGTLIEGYDRDVSKLDTVQSTFGDPALVAVYEPVILRAADGSFVPDLASSFKSSRGGRTWTFKLRKGLKFQSGAPLTAQVVVDNFNAFRGKTGQVGVFWKPTTTIKAIDDHTVVVNASAPFADFPEVCSTVYASIENVALRKKLGTNYGARRADGTGPFTLTSYQPGIGTTVKRWAGYRGSGASFIRNKGPAYLDGIKWVPILDVGQRANEISTGSVNVVRNPAPQDLARLQNDKNLVVASIPNPFRNYFITLNHQQTSLGFDDVRVRQAISHAIDRETLAKSIYFGHAVPTYGPAAPTYKYYEPGVEKFNQFNPTLSKSLLDQAGWTVGSGGTRAKGGQKLSFTLLGNSGVQTELKPVEQAIVSMLAAVGIQMNLNIPSSAADFFGVFDKADAFDFNWGWTEPIDIVILLDLTFPNPQYNGVDAALTAAIKQWQSAGSVKTLKAAASKYQLLSAQTLPQIPILTKHDVWVYSKKVRGYTPNKANFYPLYNDVWLSS
jgi:peptide/nickel transport system substrate-binding protein